MDCFLVLYQEEEGASVALTVPLIAHSKCCPWSIINWDANDWYEKSKSREENKGKNRSGCNIARDQ
jgi:hypothetical protein